MTAWNWHPSEVVGPGRLLVEKTVSLRSQGTIAMPMLLDVDRALEAVNEPRRFPASSPEESAWTSDDFRTVQQVEPDGTMRLTLCMIPSSWVAADTDPCPSAIRRAREMHPGRESWTVEQWSRTASEGAAIAIVVLRGHGPWQAWVHVPTVEAGAPPERIQVDPAPPSPNVAEGSVALDDLIDRASAWPIVLAVASLLLASLGAVLL